MNAGEFQTSVSSGEISPVTLLYGDEDFLIDECIHAILEHAVDEGTKAFNLDVVYAGKVDVREVVALASAFPMMSERRVVIVKEFEKLAASDPAKELLSAYLKKPLESTSLVLVTLRPDFRKKPFTDLKKRAVLVECKSLYDNQIPDWVAQRIRQFGKKAEPGACRLLHAYVGNSLRALQNEIDKLFIYVGDKTTISGEDVTAVVGASKGYTVFELQNAIGRKDLKQALTILQAMLQSGQSPQMVIVMLTRFLNQLWKLGELRSRNLSDAEMAREVGVHPFFFKQLIQFHNGFTADQIEQGYRALLEADTVLKSTSRNSSVVLDMMIYAMIRGEAEPAESIHQA